MRTLKAYILMMINYRKKGLNNLCSASVMCAFDIIGRDYLNGETAFTNDLDGIYEEI